MTKFSVELHRALDDWFEIKKHLTKEMYEFIKKRCNLINK